MTFERDDPTGFALWIEFDHSMSPEHMQGAAQVFSEQVRDILTNKKEPWGYGRAMVSQVLPAENPF